MIKNWMKEFSENDNPAIIDCDMAAHYNEETKILEIYSLGYLHRFRMNGSSIVETLSVTKIGF